MEQLGGEEGFAEYLQMLGIDAVWLSPVFCSTMKFYTKAILESRKIRLDRSRNGGRGDWIALAKFIIVVAVAFGAVGIILHRHNQVQQELVELRAAIQELQGANPLDGMRYYAEK